MYYFSLFSMRYIASLLLTLNNRKKKSSLTTQIVLLCIFSFICLCRLRYAHFNSFKFYPSFIINRTNLGQSTVWFFFYFFLLVLILFCSRTTECIEAWLHNKIHEWFFYLWLWYAIEIFVRLNLNIQLGQIDLLLI